MTEIFARFPTMQAEFFRPLQADCLFDSGSPAMKGTDLADLQMNNKFITGSLRRGIA